MNRAKQYKKYFIYAFGIIAVVFSFSFFFMNEPMKAGIASSQNNNIVPEKSSNSYITNDKDNSFQLTPIDTARASMEAYYEERKYALNQPREILEKQRVAVEKNIRERTKDSKGNNDVWTLSRCIVDFADMNRLDYRFLASIVAIDYNYEISEQELYSLAKDLRHYELRLGKEENVLMGYHDGIRAVLKAKYDLDKMNEDTKNFVEKVLEYKNYID